VDALHNAIVPVRVDNLLKGVAVRCAHFGARQSQRVETAALMQIQNALCLNTRYRLDNQSMKRT
jgi:hypothetical protein